MQLCIYLCTVLFVYISTFVFILYKQADCLRKSSKFVKDTVFKALFLHQFSAKYQKKKLLHYKQFMVENNYLQSLCIIIKHAEESRRCCIVHSNSVKEEVVHSSKFCILNSQNKCFQSTATNRRSRPPVATGFHFS